MNFYLIRTRLSTHLIPLRKIFSNTESFLESINKDKLFKDFEVFLSDYSEQNLASGICTINFKKNKSNFKVDIRFMQSTRLSEFCFDLVAVVWSNTDEINLKVLKEEMSLYFEKLRYKFNKDLIISDEEAISDKYTTSY